MILILCLSFVTKGQVFQQAWRGGGIGTDRVTSLAHTLDGGFLVGGVASDSSYLAGFDMGSISGFVGRFNTNGDPLWAWPAGLPSSYLDNSAPLVAATSDDHMIVAGHFGAGSVVGDSVMQPLGLGNFFLARFAPDGGMQWLRTGGTGGVRTTGLAIDPQGNIVVAGLFSGTVAIGDTGFTAFGTGNADIFTAKFDPAGDLIWARQAGGGGWYGDAANDVAVDGDGNVIICGKIRNESLFDTITLQCTITQPDCSGGFVAKYNSAGTIQWAKNAGMDCRGVATDAAGNIYVTGDRNFNLAFDTIMVIGHNGSEHYTAKMDPDGNYLWLVVPTDGNMETPRDIAVDQNGTCYVTGLYTGNMVLAGFPASGDVHADYFLYAADTDGQVLWLKHGLVAAPGSSSGYAVAIDAGCGLLVGGEFKNTPDFLLGTIDLGPAPSAAELWIARMDACDFTTGMSHGTVATQGPFLFPVPSSDRIQVGALPGAYNYDVVDMLGAVVMRGRVGEQGAIAVDRLGPGAYGLLVRPMEGHPVLLRFIKE